MPVIMKPPQRHERKRALVLIIDKSGSMGRNDKLEYAKAAALTVSQDAQRQRSDQRDRIRLAAVRGDSAGDRGQQPALLRRIDQPAQGRAARPI